MKFPGFMKSFLKVVIPKGWGPRMSKYAQQYNLPSRKLTRKLTRRKLALRRSTKRSKV